MQEQTGKLGLVAAQADGFGQHAATRLSDNVLCRARAASLVLRNGKRELDYAAVVKRMPSLEARERTFAFIQFGQVNRNSEIEDLIHRPLREVEAATLARRGV